MMVESLLFCDDCREAIRAAYIPSKARSAVRSGKKKVMNEYRTKMRKRLEQKRLGDFE